MRYRNTVQPVMYKINQILTKDKNIVCTILLVHGHEIHKFRGGATFEMIELNTEKCIFQLIKIVAAQRLINGRR